MYRVGGLYRRAKGGCGCNTTSMSPLRRSDSKLCNAAGANLTAWNEKGWRGCPVRGVGEEELQKNLKTS